MGKSGSIWAWCFRLGAHGDKCGCLDASVCIKDPWNHTGSILVTCSWNTDEVNKINHNPRFNGFLAWSQKSKESMLSFVNFNCWLPEIGNTSAEIPDLRTLRRWLHKSTQTIRIIALWWPHYIGSTSRKNQVQECRCNDFTALALKIMRSPPKTFDLMRFWVCFLEMLTSTPKVSIWCTSGLDSSSGQSESRASKMARHVIWYLCSKFPFSHWCCFGY